MKLVLGLCVVAIAVFAAIKEEKAEFKNTIMISSNNSGVKLICIGDYAFVGLGVNAVQPISKSTGKPMSCDEAKKEFLK